MKVVYQEGAQPSNNWDDEDDEAKE
jgi:hypothetical protein